MVFTCMKCESQNVDASCRTCGYCSKSRSSYDSVIEEVGKTLPGDLCYIDFGRPLSEEFCNGFPILAASIVRDRVIRNNTVLCKR